VIAASITNWFADKSNRKIVDKLRKGGVRFDNVVVSSLPQTLLGPSSSPARSRVTPARKPRLRSRHVVASHRDR